jgi:hypothetical protein
VLQTGKTLETRAIEKLGLNPFIGQVEQLLERQ